MLNISPNLNDLAAPISGPHSISIGELIGQMCQQFDGQMMTVGVLVISYFLFHLIILPRARIGLEGIEMLEPIRPMIDKGFSHLDSLLETVSLGAALYLIAVLWIQGLMTSWHFAALAVLFGFVGLAALAAFVEWVRGMRDKWRS